MLLSIKNYDVITYVYYVYYGLGSNGRWIKMNQNPSLAQVDHTTLSNMGTNTHAQIDAFINSSAQPKGLATLDSNRKVNANQIPSLAITSTQSVSTIAQPDALANVQEGDVVLVTNDTTPANNGSYIYNGSSWSTLSLYVNGTALSALTDVNLGVLATGNLLTYDSVCSKWKNTDALPDNTLWLNGV